MVIRFYEDGTVRVGNAYITHQTFHEVKALLKDEKIQQALNLLVLASGFSPILAELIVYELI